MEMVTYYLGAGASCNCLPLTRDIPYRIAQLAEEIPEVYRDRQDEKLPDSEEKITDVVSRLVEDLTWLEKIAQNHYSVDTCAKALYLADDAMNLTRLKAALSAFFLFEQVRRPVDTRYDSFWASVLDRKQDQGIMLPSNVRILSWNYDSQPEISFHEICGRSSAEFDKLQVHPTNTGDDRPIETDRFVILRLNGIAGAHLLKGKGVARRLLLHCERGPRQDDTILFLWALYSDNRFQDVPPLLNFAWEENIYTRKFMPIVERVASSTTTLVVIGYSFPFFNRIVDRRVLGWMESLSKVYVQAPASARADLLDRLSILLPSSVAIEYKEGTEQFFVPPEFDYR